MGSGGRSVAIDLSDRGSGLRQVTVVLTHFLRGQERFDGIDALIAQMRADCEAARAAASGPA